MIAYTRRDFLTALSGAVLLTPIVAQAQNSQLKIKFLCPRWGNTQPWDDFCKRVKEAGYDGVESSVTADAALRQEMLMALKKYKLDLVIQALPGAAEFTEHRRSYETMLRDFVKLKPLFINSQTGKDFFSFDENKQLLEASFLIARESNVKIIHETHRGKFSFAAHITRNFLEKVPGLRLTLDISHWCNVAESLLENQKEAVDLTISRTDHIHARVGHQEGPQVNDPRAPEWDKAIQAHLSWWDAIVARHKSTGSSVLTITPEFGPPNYMPTKPHTREPLADQWEVNVYMMNLLRKRYNS